MSLSVQPSAEAPLMPTLAAEWVNFMGEQEAPHMPNTVAEQPLCRASLQLARVCTAATVNPEYSPYSPLILGLKQQLKTPVNRHQREEAAMHTSLEHGLLLVEGRSDDQTARRVMELTHVSAVAAAAAANYALQDLCKRPHVPKHKKHTIIGHRAEMTLLGLATLVSEKDETVVAALPHQRKGSSRANNFDAIHIAQGPSTQVRRVQFTNRCIGAEGHVPSQDVLEQYNPGILVVSACCDLQPDRVHTGNRLPNIAAMLKQRARGNGRREDTIELYKLHDRVKQAIFDDAGHRGKRVQYAK